MTPDERIRHTRALKRAEQAAEWAETVAADQCEAYARTAQAWVAIAREIREGGK